MIAEIVDGQLIVRPKESAETLLAKPRFDIPSISPRRVAKLRNKLAKEPGERS